MKTITASDKSALIKLASELPKGDSTRKAILAGLRVVKTASLTKGSLVLIPKGTTYTVMDGSKGRNVQRETAQSTALFFVGQAKSYPGAFVFTNASASNQLQFTNTDGFVPIDVSGIVDSLTKTSTSLSAKDRKMLVWLVGNMKVLGCKWSGQDIEAATTGVDDNHLKQFPPYEKLRKLLDLVNGKAA